MATLTPGEVTARSEHSGMANAGEMGSVCQTCARPVQVQFFYDDPMKTPITDLEIQLADSTGAVLVDGMPTEAPLARGLQDATPGVGDVRPDLGGVTYGEVPYAAGALTVTTNPSQDIQSAADEALQLQREIITSLWTFEVSMKTKFQPYVDEWQTEGWGGVGSDFVNGVGKGISDWWDGEKDFWGSAWGALKSSAAAIDNYYQNNPELYLGMVGLSLHLNKLGRQAIGALGEWWADDGPSIIDFLENLTDLMKAFLTADIDGIIRELEALTGLEDLPGVIGEFGLMIKEALADGVDWMRDMIELVRSSDVLSLMINTAMRCIMLMTPNFWAKVLGEGVGFIVPELLIWLVTTLIAALSAGAGATVLAARCASIASKIRGLIKGSAHVGKILSFMDELKPIFDKVGALAKKLRQVIVETKAGIVSNTQRLMRSSRYWRTRLDDLIRQGHGPQRHEGDVTDRQLLDRSLRGLDPMTNSPVDSVGFRRKYGVDYDPITHGVPPDFGGRSINVPGKGNLPIVMNSKIQHVIGDHATKFNTPADYVIAYDKLVESGQYKSFLSGVKIQEPIKMPLSEIFGPNFQPLIKGYARDGTPTVFGPGSEVIAIFRKENGVAKLVTMYPNP